MYEVNLRTSPDRLLDWDKPLAGQSSQVKKALKKSELWSDYDRKHNALMGSDMAPSTSKMTGWLREAGIDGIQYLDGGSRTAGAGTSNYVMFDDKLIDVLRRYGLLGMAGGGAAAVAGAPE